MSMYAKKTTPNKPSVRWWKWVLPILVIGAIAFAIFTISSPAQKTLAPEINVELASELRSNGAFVLDVREISEWNESHVPGAKLIPLADLSSRLSEIPRDQTVVVICRSGNRSKQGRDILLEAGFTQVTSIAGGIKAWSAAGYETVTGP